MEAFLRRSARGIWDEKAVGLIYQHYAGNLRLHLNGAEFTGHEPLAAHVLQTLAASPDLRLYGGEVIWNGSGQGGFDTSHRIHWSGHHLGHSLYGPPSGKRVRCREITDARVQGERIVEMWTVRDDASLVRQLGLDPVDVARTLAQAEASLGRSLPPRPSGEVPRSHGQRPPALSLEREPGDPEQLPGQLYGLVWNARMFNHLQAFYAPEAVVWMPGRRLEGPSELTHYILQWLAAFPDGAIQLDHVTVSSATRTPSGAQGHWLAARWTFQGTHDGPGGYGPPTGRQVRFMGISHFELLDGRIRREHTVWSELSLLKQLHWPE